MTVFGALTIVSRDKIVKAGRILKNYFFAGGGFLRFSATHPV